MQENTETQKDSFTNSGEKLKAMSIFQKILNIPKDFLDCSLTYQEDAKSRLKISKGRKDIERILQMATDIKVDTIEIVKPEGKEFSMSFYRDHEVLAFLKPPTKNFYFDQLNKAAKASCEEYKKCNDTNDWSGSFYGNRVKLPKRIGKAFIHTELEKDGNQKITIYLNYKDLFYDPTEPSLQRYLYRDFTDIEDTLKAQANACVS